MTTVSIQDIEAAAADASQSRTYSPPTISRQYRALFECQECGRKFATVRAARRAQDDGCPRCGAADIDLV